MFWRECEDEEGRNLFDRELVIRACENTLEVIKEKRLEDRERLIQQQMKKRHFFSRKPFTREEACKHLTNGDWYSSFNMAPTFYSGQEDLAKEVLKAARICQQQLF